MSGGQKSGKGLFEYKLFNVYHFHLLKIKLEVNVNLQDPEYPENLVPSE